MQGMRTLGIRRHPEWLGADILSVKQLSREDLQAVFDVAHELRQVVERVGTVELLRGKILANVFYEPSTRTSSSFAAAMMRLGGDVLAINGMTYSSVAKGESLRDTVRTLEAYADVLVLRHPDIGAAQIAADATRLPLINAGDGAGEHPTQALLDMFTIREELGSVEGLEVALVGDLKFGRTVHSLARLLAMYGVTIRFVSPPSQQLPPEILAELDAAGALYSCHDVLDDVLPSADVLYITRVQKERFEDLALYEAIKHRYIVTRQTLERIQPHTIIMHPFPRVGEIAEEVDDDPRAAYFRQMSCGLYVRMALLTMVLGRA